ncbi:MAG: phosphomannomutase [Pseudohongiellaceae bacterium]|jgi:phosphomannomutase
MLADTDHLACFKAYDLRGRVPDELNVDIARAVGRAFVTSLGAKKVAVGYDIRPSSPELSAALIDGLTAQGADVIDIGQCGTEMIYFAAQHLEAEGVDGGIIVTASHNPSDYNGMKLVTVGARPVSGDTGLNDIERLVLADNFASSAHRGKVIQRSIMDDYLDHLLSYIDVSACSPLRIVSNGGNGCAGPVVEALAKRLPFEIIPVYHEPDGSFPHGVPNPLLPENRLPTTEAVRQHGADLGLAWDGDFDRCFFFDEKGGFIEGYYIVGLLAAEMLRSNPGEKIIYEPRLTWNSIECIEAAGGVPVLTKTGHAFIKERMRKEDALYGGEMSAHHYFRDFAYCDSGMIPWLLVCQLISRTGKTLSELVEKRQERFPVSGELNNKIADPHKALEHIRSLYEPVAERLDTTDGLAFEFPEWRFNVRLSNTEPVVRLNVETRGDTALLREKTDELQGLLRKLA